MLPRSWQRGILTRPCKSPPPVPAISHVRMTSPALAHARLSGTQCRALNASSKTPSFERHFIDEDQIHNHLCRPSALALREGGDRHWRGRLGRARAGGACGYCRGRRGRACRLPDRQGSAPHRGPLDGHVPLGFLPRRRHPHVRVGWARSGFVGHQGQGTRRARPRATWRAASRFH